MDYTPDLMAIFGGVIIWMVSAGISAVIAFWNSKDEEGKVMGMFVNPGNAAFQAALNARIYVDKSGLLEYTNSVLASTDAFLCCSRPRRFGKSVTANMLTAYYSKGCNSQAMFSALSIAKTPDYERHLNRYDVIHWDVQWCIEPAGGPEQVVSYVTDRTIQELRIYYPDAVPAAVRSLPEALAEIYNRTGSKFIIIIDEWDVLIRDEATNQKVQEEFINFLRGIFKGTEPAKYIQLAYLTGILPIKREKTQSALNNFEEFTMLSSGNLAPYTGFTEAEVRGLSEKYHQSFDKVKQWYDGYLLNGCSIYNPRAVASVMVRGEFRSYWSETASYDAIVPLINRDYNGLKTALIEMLAGGTVRVNTATFKNDTINIRSRDDVLTYMIHLGYLGFDQERGRAFVPNEEIRQELRNAVESRSWDEFITFQQESEALLQATLSMDEETVAEQIEKVHNEYASVIRYHDENSLSSVLSIAYLSAMRFYFKPIREFPTGRGFADFVFLPKPEYVNEYPALVVELKWNQNAQTAMQQIIAKKYPSSIEAYTGNILLVALNYDKASKEHQCLIQMVEK